MSAPDPRPGLASRKRPRPHPASPAVAGAIAPASTDHADIGLVMFCVRVTPSLRRRVKLAAVASGRTIQQLAVEALEDVCRHHEP